MRHDHSNTQRNARTLTDQTRPDRERGIQTEQKQEKR